MVISSDIRQIFGHFQNLNLLALLEDLENDRVARHTWSTGTRLCPIAHGLPNGQRVQCLKTLGQTADLARGCYEAAGYLCADFAIVLRFVQSWDGQFLRREWLLQQLQNLWQERLQDAEAMQEFLQATRGRLLDGAPTKASRGFAPFSVSPAITGG